MAVHHVSRWVWVLIGLVIYPERVREADGSWKRVDLVVGDYADRFEYRGANPQPVWERRCFVAEEPYRPIQPEGAPPQAVLSVVCYLDAARKTDAGIAYRYAWWREPRWSTAFWMSVGVLAIAILWPTLMNLLTYGKLLRPRQPKGIDLSKVSRAAEPPKPMVSQADLERAAAWADEVEAAMRASAAPAQEAARQAAGAAEVRTLDAGQLQEAAAQTPGHTMEFGQKQDDFYPTERHAHPGAPQPPAGRGTAGFSLVELLVVIGIIGILIAFLLPALAVAREHAKQVQCQATLHGIGLSAQFHVNEHAGFLPLCGWQFDPIGGTLNPAGVQDNGERRYDYYLEDGVKRPLPITAALAISAGVKIRTDSREHLTQDLQLESVRRLFRCPSQEAPIQGGSMGDGQGWEAPREWCSYIFSEALLARRNQPWEFPQGHMVRVKRPSGVMFAIDGKPRGYFSVFDMNTHFTMYDFRAWVQQKPSDGPDVLDYTRHQYRANVLFCDWHVESLPLTDGGLREIGISNGIYN